MTQITLTIKFLVDTEVQASIITDQIFEEAEGTVKVHGGTLLLLQRTNQKESTK